MHKASEIFLRPVNIEQRHQILLWFLEKVAQSAGCALHFCVKLCRRPLEATLVAKQLGSEWLDTLQLGVRNDAIQRLRQTTRESTPLRTPAD